MTDNELMHRFQQGDNKAFEALYTRYKPKIFSFLIRHLVSPENSLEMTHEVFLRVIRSADSFHNGSRFDTWIFKIARNLLVDFYRRDRLRRHDSLDRKIGLEGPMLRDCVRDNGPSPDRASIAVRLRSDLVLAISALPDEQREVFLLREYHGLPFDQIGEVVEANVSTVKSRMRYALSTLRNALSSYCEYAAELP